MFESAIVLEIDFVVPSIEILIEKQVIELCSVIRLSNKLIKICPVFKFGWYLDPSSIETLTKYEQES